MEGLHNLIYGNSPIKSLGSRKSSDVMGLYPYEVHVCIVNLGVVKFYSVFNPRRDSRTLNILGMARFVRDKQYTSNPSGILGLVQITLKGPDRAK